MYYFVDKVLTERLPTNAELILTQVTSHFAENIIIKQRSSKNENRMMVCIHNPLTYYVFKKFPYLQTLNRKDSMPMVKKGDMIFVIDTSTPDKTYTLINVQ